LSKNSVTDETVVKAMHAVVTKIQQDEDMPGPRDWTKSTSIPIFKRNEDPQD